MRITDKGAMVGIYASRFVFLGQMLGAAKCYHDVQYA